METLDYSNSSEHIEQPPHNYLDATAGEFTFDGPTTNLEGEELLLEVRRQIESIFQKQRQLSDNHLATYVNSEGFVPLGAFLNVPEIYSLTASIDILCDALASSSIVTLDESRKLVKSNLKVQRTTIIIRDIPSATPVEQVTAIFEREGAPGVVTGIRPEIGDNWFVSFESEDIALATLAWLRSQNFEGNTIKARIKSENMVKSFYIPPAEPPPEAYAANYAGYSAPAAQESSGYRGANANYAYWDSNSKNGDSGGFQRGSSGSNYDRGDRRSNYRGRRKGEGYRKPNAPLDNPDSLPSGGRGGARKPRGGRGGKKPGDFLNNPKPFGAPAAPAHAPPLGPAHFPPLPSVKADPAAVPGGYANKFRKYSTEEMVALLPSFSDVSLPASMKPAECIAISVEANTQLENVRLSGPSKISIEDTSGHEEHDDSNKENVQLVNSSPAQDEDFVDQSDESSKKDDQKASKFSYADIARTGNPAQ